MRLLYITVIHSTMSSPNSSTLWWTSWTWSSLRSLLLRWSSNSWHWDLTWDLLHTFLPLSLITLLQWFDMQSWSIRVSAFTFVPFLLFLFVFWTTQHYFIDAWNSFDALIVVGSLVDIMIAEFSVCNHIWSMRNSHAYPSLQWLKYYIFYLRHTHLSISIICFVSCSSVCIWMVLSLAQGGGGHGEVRICHREQYEWKKCSFVTS